MIFLKNILVGVVFFFFNYRIYKCYVFVVPPQVLQHVRLPLLSPKFLVGTVGSDPLIKSDEECRCVYAPSPPFLFFKDVRLLK